MISKQRTWIAALALLALLVVAILGWATGPHSVSLTTNASEETGTFRRHRSRSWSATSAGPTRGASTSSAAWCTRSSSRTASSKC